MPAGLGNSGRQWLHSAFDASSRKNSDDKSRSKLQLVVQHVFSHVNSYVEVRKIVNKLNYQILNIIK